MNNLKNNAMMKSTCRLRRLACVLLVALAMGSVQAFAAFAPEQDIKKNQKKLTKEELAIEDKVDSMLYFFNEAKYDSVFPIAREMMAYCEKHKLIRKKMQAWHMVVGAYHYTGQYNKALREVKNMYEDAHRYDSEYGEAMAYFNLGSVYFSMNHVEESAEAFEKALPLIRNIDKTVLLEMLPFYCDALEALERYEKLDSVTRQWWQVIEERFGNGDMRDKEVILANYFIACAQYNLGRDHLREAEHFLNQAEKNVEGKNNFEYLYLIYYRAKLRLKQGRYKEALALNTERLKWCSEIDDIPTLVPVHKQRADILMAAGRYQEAAKMYARTYELSDSLNQATTITQLNELRTMFKVDELETVNTERESRLEAMEAHSAWQRSRFISIITAVISVCLLFVMLLIWYSARKLRNKNRELAQRNDELKLASERAEASLKMKTDFIHQISHEIRTPLNVLSGFSQILTTSGDSLDNDTRQSINHRIVESTTRITDLVNKMLELSEASSETTIERTDEVTPVRIAQEAITMTSVCSQEHVNFEYVADAAVHMLVLRTSLKQATRVIYLLLGNAVKFLHPQGEDLTQGTVRFLVKPSADGQFINFIVEDTGKGVPVEEAEHIFEEFVQLDEYYEGTGVGLTVARSIARRLGGDVVLDTTYTEGARFVFSLPKN